MYMLYVTYVTYTRKGETMRFSALAALIASLSALAPHGADAGSYPDKPIKMIAAFAPGGTSDYLARALAKAGSEALRQPVVVENRPGAGGMIGLDYLAKSHPDGYTIGIASGALSIYPSTSKTMPFDAVADFDFYGLIGRAPSVLLVSLSHPAKTFEEFVAHAKNNPKQAYGSAGVGTNTQFTGELLNLEMGLDLRHVPYKGGSPQIADVVGGHITIAIAGLTTALPFIQSGKVRALAVSTAKRSKAVPDVPTLQELGVKGIDTAEWFALLAPRGTPDEIGSIWNEIIANLVKDPTLTEQSPALEPSTMTREELKAFVAREVDLWKDVAKKANIAAE